MGGIKQSINATTNAIAAKINGDFSGEAPIGVNVIGVYGSDELNWRKENGRYVLDDNQPTKVKRPCVIICRYGERGGLIDVLSDPDGIKRHTKASVVLTPGTPKNSSTAAIEALRSGVTSSFQTQAVPLVMHLWSPSAIEHRKAQEAIDDEVPSVTQINKDVLRIYSSLVGM
jgi:hypothetical protein